MLRRLGSASAGNSRRGRSAAHHPTRCCTGLHLRSPTDCVSGQCFAVTQHWIQVRDAGGGIMVAGPRLAVAHPAEWTRRLTRRARAGSTMAHTNDLDRDLRIAAQDGDLTEVRALLDRGASASAALQAAIPIPSNVAGAAPADAALPIVQAMIAAGADVNGVSFLGRTALGQAAE